MTTLEYVEFDCPVCESHFRSQAVLSTNSFGGKRTDFHERAAGTQPLPYLVHTCTRCFHTGSQTDYQQRELPAHVKASIYDHFGELKSRPTPLAGHEKYELAAKIAEWCQEDARQLADLYLRAAWCCVDEADTEAERYFRRKAAYWFQEALETYDQVAREERAVLTYLTGELWRRIGDLTRATEWFNQVPAAVVDPQLQQWVLDVARQQRDCPREWFG